jgi:Ion channel
MEPKQMPQPRFADFGNWSAFEFLVSLVLMIFAAPFVEDFSHGPLVEAILLTFMLASAVVAVSDHRFTRITSMLLAILAIAGRWTHHFRPDLSPPAIYLGAGLGLLAFVLVQYLRYILRAPQVTFIVLCAAVSTYLMMGLLWAIAYVLVATLQPNSFAFSANAGTSGAMTGFNAFYFSFVTLSTVGYGDIVPVSRAARMLAAMEATTGTLYVAILIARLVSMYASPPSKR